jgi:hypothetical protein
MGGGGAGLGGVIFNEGGSLTILNSTFDSSIAFGGPPGTDCTLCGSPAKFGAGAGGAIFSLNGTVTINDSTLTDGLATDSGNQIEVFATADGSVALNISNTILFSSFTGKDDCFGIGTVLSAGTGNLIGSSTNCNVAAVSTANPALGPLQLNAPGNTPTRAITTSSPAYRAADTATSLPTDQRGVGRLGGVDIGAFDLCFDGPPLLQVPCRSLVSVQPPPPQTLTMQVSPVTGGTTTPAVGQYAEAQNSVIVIQATPNPGFGFTGWSPNVADPANSSTTVVMDQDQTVTAFFAACSVTLNGRGTASSTYSPARVGLAWTSLANVDHYDVMRGASAAGPFTKIDSVTAGTTSYSDTTVTDKTMYAYTADAMDVNGNAVCVSNAKGIYVP